MRSCLGSAQSSSESRARGTPGGITYESMRSFNEHLGLLQAGWVLGFAMKRYGPVTTFGDPVPVKGDKEPLWDFGYSVTQTGASFPANGKCERASLTALLGGATGGGTAESGAGDPLCGQEQRAVSHGPEDGAVSVPPGPADTVSVPRPAFTPDLQQEKGFGAWQPQRLERVTTPKRLALPCFHVCPIPSRGAGAGPGLPPARSRGCLPSTWPAPQGPAWEQPGNLLELPSLGKPVPKPER